MVKSDLTAWGIGELVRWRAGFRRRAPLVVGTGACGILVALLTVSLIMLLSHPEAVAQGGNGQTATPSPTRVLPRTEPLVIAHRGASGERAENTISAYRLASEMGADYVEGDLVVTQDGVLVARHERALSTTTDVGAHPEFASRRTSKEISGTLVTDWFAEDFTLAELKTLQATTRHRSSASSSIPQSSDPIPAENRIPTVSEIIAFVQDERVTHNHTIGLYLELKDPTYLTSLGLAPEPLIATALRSASLAETDAQVFIESFDTQSLITVHGLINTPLVQLIGGVGGAEDPTTSAAALATISGYASGIGIERDRLLTAGAPDPTLVNAAHTANLEVHVYTFSNEVVNDSVLATYRSFFDIGIDGVFTDNPDIAQQARQSSQSTG